MPKENKIITKQQYRKIALLVVLYGGFFIFLFSTDPRKLAIGWLILPFLWLYACLFITFRYIFNWTFGRSTNRRQALLAGVLAAIPTLMLLLDSVDQLSLKDFFLILALGILALFYVRKISLKQNRN